MKLLLTIVLTLCAFLAGAQTNEFYTQGQFTQEVAPTLSSASFFNNHAVRTTGASLETEYWQTVHTGTGIELGTYDARNVDFGPIDHIAVMEDLRVAPFTQPFLDRFAGELKSGAETFLIDGSKDLEIGCGFTIAITPRWQFDANYMQHWRTNTRYDGGTIRFGLKFVF